MTVELNTANILSINGRPVGQVLAVTDWGKIQPATANKVQIAAQFRPIVTWGTLGDPVRIDLPVFVSDSPSRHRINPALIAAIEAIINS